MAAKNRKSKRVGIFIRIDEGLYEEMKQEARLLAVRLRAAGEPVRTGGKASVARYLESLHEESKRGTGRG